MTRTTRKTTHAGDRGPRWIEALAAAGHVRTGWHYCDKVWNKAALLAVGLGAWGILTGYALFALLWHERHHPWKFVVALLFAAIASFVVESVRGLILGHREEKLNGPRLIITILTLAIVELFVVAVHSIAIPSAAAFAEMRDAVFGAVVAKHVPAAVSLVALGSIWVIVGGVLAGALMLAAPGATGSLRRRVGLGAIVGAFVGALAAPLTLLGVVVVIRIVGLVAALVTEPHALVDHVDAIRQSHAIAGYLLAPVSWLGRVWAYAPLGRFPIGPILVIAGLIGLVTSRHKGALAWALAILALIFLPVGFAGFPALLKLLGVAALVWCFPAAAIGALAPTLRRPAEDARTWGAVALAAGCLLALLVVVRLASWWLLLPALLLVATFFVLRPGRRLNEYWPLVALIAALVVAGATWAGQATFGTVFERFHEVNDVDILLKPAPRPAITPRIAPAVTLHGMKGLLAHPALIGTDEALDRLAAGVTPGLGATAADAAEVARVHAEWKGIAALPDGPDGRVAAKARLHERVARVVAGLAPMILTGGPRRAYYVALEARLRRDLAEAREAEALRSEERMKTELAAQEAQEAATAASEADARAAERRESRRLLEICLCGSLGFWVSVGLLAGFSLLRTRGHVVRFHDGVKRCFWAAAPGALAYHDGEHGVTPASDAEFFRRLAVELLLEGKDWEKRDQLAAQFDGFDPVRLAARPPLDGAASGAREACDRRPLPRGVAPLRVTPVGMSLVMENAQRLMAWYETQASGETRPDPSGTALLDDLRGRLRDPDVDAARLVAHFSELFCLRKSTPAATFLQAVGLLPGAHFDGCARFP